MSKIEGQGWKAIGACRLVEPQEEPTATIHYTRATAQPSALQMLRRFLTEELVGKILLPMINGKLKEASRHHDRSESWLISALDVQHFWCFFAHYLAHNLETRKAVKSEDIGTIDRAKKLMYEKRFQAIHARVLPNEEQLKAFVSAMRCSIPSVIKLGAVVAVDDRIVSYFGQSMRDAGLAVDMAGKPHSYGQLMLVAAQKLPLCGLPVFLDVELRYPGPKWTPSEGTLALVNRLGPHLPPQATFIADSAALSKVMLNSYMACPVKWALSVKERRAAHFQQLWEFGQKVLLKDHSRTYWNGHLLLQISDRDGDHITSIITNAFRPVDSPASSPAPLVRYDTAIVLSHEPREALLAILKVPPEALQLDKAGIIMAVTHIDPSKPPELGMASAQASMPELMKHTAPQLQARVRAIPGQAKSTGLNKKEMAKILFKYHGGKQEDEGAGVTRTRRGMQLDVYEEQLRGECHRPAPVTAFWVHHYGSIDQLNRELYQLFILARTPTWEASLLWSLLATLILNSYAAFHELRMLHAYNASGGSRAKAMEVQRTKADTPYQFAILLLQDLLVELASDK